MNSANILRAAEAIKARYMKMGGKVELFDSFLKALIDFNEFFLEEYEYPSQLISKVFGPKYTGERVKFDIREVVGKQESDAGLKFDFIEKRWK